MNKQLLLLFACIGLTFNSFAQVLLADTAFSTESRPDSTGASCVFKPGGQTKGIDASGPSMYGVADDFTIPAGAYWQLDSITVFGYQLNKGKTSPFKYVFLQIRKDSITGPVVFGDGLTNRFTSTGWTNLYRVDTAGAGIMDTSRRIMFVNATLTPKPVLSNGTYWIIYKLHGTSGDGVASYTVPKVLPGRVNPAGQNGQRSSTGTWLAAIDSTVQGTTESLGFNFIIHGKFPTAIVSTPRQELHAAIAPQPAHTTANISFILPKADRVAVSISDMVGRNVLTLPAQQFAGGNAGITIDISPLPAGTYIYQLQTSNERECKIFQVAR